MAYNSIHFENPHTGALKEAPVGFSWTMFFFGFFVPLIRGDWKWSIVCLLIISITGGVFWFVFPFFYNKLYVKELISQGYKVKLIKEGNLNNIEKRLNLSLPLFNQN
jgi:hypothetical protein